MKNKLKWLFCMPLAFAVIFSFGTANVEAAAIDEIAGAFAVTPAAVTPAAAPQFTDVAVTDWFYPYVTVVCDDEYEFRVMNGVGNNRFAPNDTTTRAMMITILHRLSECPDPVDRYSYFLDLDEINGWWYIDPVLWAENYDIVKGTSPNAFSPNQAVTREQLVTIFYRYMQKWWEINPGYDSSALYGFADRNAVSSYAREAMCWAVDNGIVEGMRGDDLGMYLNPRSSATRAQIAAIVCRFCVYFNNEYL